MQRRLNILVNHQLIGQILSAIFLLHVEGQIDILESVLHSKKVNKLWVSSTLPDNAFNKLSRRVQKLINSLFIAENAIPLLEPVHSQTGFAWEQQSSSLNN